MEQLEISSAADIAAEEWYPGSAESASGGEWDVDVADIMDGVTDDDETEAPAAQADQPEPAAEERFTLKHLGETRDVGRDEVVSLAQKGIDYDRVRVKYDAANAELAEARKWISKLSDGKTLDELRDGAEADTVAGAEKIDRSAALERIRRAREDKSAASLRRTRELAEFSAAFPEAAESIAKGGAELPGEVWERVRAGVPLADAYAGYTARREAAQRSAELERTRAELDSERKKHRNASLSTGSQATDGGEPPYDPIAAGWNSI